MRDVSAAPAAARRSCEFDWCVTDHGSTIHPDDEDHRSSGFAALVRARKGDSRGPGEDTELEVGALRRQDDTETWVVIETGIGVSLALSRAGARSLQRLLLDGLGPDDALSGATAGL